MRALETPRRRLLTFALLEDDAIAQLTRSATAFERHATAQTQQSRFSAQMHWLERGGTVQLVKTYADGKEHTLGPRTEERLALHRKYLAGQLAAQQALDVARQDLRATQGRNLAFGIARVPTIVIQILNALENKGLSAYYRVIGTHALYAYEVAAGVVFDAQSTATRDVDLLWDVQQRIKLVANLDAAGLTMLELLNKFKGKQMEVMFGNAWYSVVGNGIDEDLGVAYFTVSYDEETEIVVPEGSIQAMANLSVTGRSSGS